ncbi:hypothetical protein F4777DRAFT_408331 [Nemania sp. FL0916]|nr:hypothetical protein F4777DRAFT_408331 [Nemania sp. FL0916]
MVLLKYKVDPADVKAKVKVGLSASPSISLSDPAAELRLTLNIRMESSVNQGQPITFMVDNTVFEVHEDGDGGGMDIFSRGGFGSLRSTSQEPNKSISLGLFRVNGRPKSESPDLRERGCRFVTVPGDGSCVAVTHTLDWSRIFKYEDRRTKDDLVPGERFEIGMGKGSFGSMWWCWGDLETDLKDKKLHVWHPGPFADERPDERFVQEGNWVLGEEPMLLEWVADTENERVTFKVVD